MRAGAAAILLTALITGVLSCSSGAHEEPAEIRIEIATEELTDGAALRNLQFYIHQVELLDERGAARPFKLAAAAPFQSGEVALLDLAGEAATSRHQVIRGAVAVTNTRFAGIRFTVGVPFRLNHADPLTAAAPLDRPALFWTWQSGYKFLRADLSTQGRDWSFHLGSTGCSSASALRPPAEACQQPNRIRVELKGDPLRDVIRFHPAPLLAAARAADFVICTGDYLNNPACANAYASTALVMHSGLCQGAHCEGQRLWTLDSR